MLVLHFTSIGNEEHQRKDAMTILHEIHLRGANILHATANGKVMTGYEDLKNCL